MYGTVPCAVQYSSSIPRKEFDHDFEADMIVTKVFAAINMIIRYGMVSQKIFHFTGLFHESRPIN